MPKSGALSKFLLASGSFAAGGLATELLAAQVLEYHQARLVCHQERPRSLFPTVSCEGLPAGYVTRAEPTTGKVILKPLGQLCRRHDVRWV